MTVQLARDDPRIVNPITSVYRTSLGNVRTRMKFVMRDVTPRVRHEDWNEGLATGSQDHVTIVSI